jgi:hypothetical protein
MIFLDLKEAAGRLRMNATDTGLPDIKKVFPFCESMP